MSQPKPKINNHPFIGEMILNDIETNGEHLPQGDALSELYGASCKLGIFLKAAKDKIQDGEVLKAAVVEDINKRINFGIEKYGVALQPFNGRDAVLDAYEEVLDLIFYLRQAVYESQNADIQAEG